MSAIIVKIVKEYLWGIYFAYFALSYIAFFIPKHYVSQPQTVCLTMSNMLFDNFNIYISCSQGLCLTLIVWLSEDYGCMRILGVFYPSDFRSGFRGHSRDSKWGKIDYMFSRHKVLLAHKTVPTAAIIVGSRKTWQTHPTWSGVYI